MSEERTTIGGVQCLTAKGKAQLLRSTAAANGLRTFVETGTHDGDTLAAVMAPPFVIDRAFSVELSETYYERACGRFVADTRVELAKGDSAAYLRELLPRLEGPDRDQAALFWLDAHPGEPGTAGTYGESPLRAELHAIFDMQWRDRANGPVPRGPNHVVLVDDVRLFRESGWPSMKEIEQIAAGWKVEHRTDILLISRTSL